MKIELDRQPGATPERHPNAQGREVLIALAWIAGGVISLLLCTIGITIIEYVRGHPGQPAYWRAYRPTDLSGPVQDVDCGVVELLESVDKRLRQIRDRNGL